MRTRRFCGGLSHFVNLLTFGLFGPGGPFAFLFFAEEDSILADWVVTETPQRQAAKADGGPLLVNQQLLSGISFQLQGRQYIIDLETDPSTAVKAKLGAKGLTVEGFLTKFFGGVPEENIEAAKRTFGPNRVDWPLPPSAASVIPFWQWAMIVAGVAGLIGYGWYWVAGMVVVAAVGGVKALRVEALRVEASRGLSVAVMRRAKDGSLKARRVPSVELVPGDLAILEPGRVVPADIVVLRGSVVMAGGDRAEALVSGEKIEKTADFSGHFLPYGRRVLDCSSGSCVGLVWRTGGSTRLAKRATRDQLLYQNATWGRAIIGGLAGVAGLGGLYLLLGGTIEGLVIVLGLFLWAVPLCWVHAVVSKAKILEIKGVALGRVDALAALSAASRIELDPEDIETQWESKVKWVLEFDEKNEGFVTVDIGRSEEMGIPKTVYKLDKNLEIIGNIGELRGELRGDIEGELEEGVEGKKRRNIRGDRERYRDIERNRLKEKAIEGDSAMEKIILTENVKDVEMRGRGGGVEPLRGPCDSVLLGGAESFGAGALQSLFASCHGLFLTGGFRLEGEEIDRQLFELSGAKLHRDNANIALLGLSAVKKIRAFPPRPGRPRRMVAVKFSGAAAQPRLAAGGDYNPDASVGEVLGDLSRAEGPDFEAERFVCFARGAPEAVLPRLERKGKAAAEAAAKKLAEAGLEPLLAVAKNLDSAPPASKYAPLNDRDSMIVTDHEGVPSIDEDPAASDNQRQDLPVDEETLLPTGTASLLAVIAVERRLRPSLVSALRGLRERGQPPVFVAAGPLESTARLASQTFPRPSATLLIDFPSQENCESLRLRCSRPDDPTKPAEAGLRATPTTLAKALVAIARAGGDPRSAAAGMNGGEGEVLSLLMGIAAASRPHNAVIACTPAALIHLEASLSPTDLEVFRGLLSAVAPVPDKGALPSLGFNFLRRGLFFAPEIAATALPAVAEAASSLRFAWNRALDYLVLLVAIDGVARLSATSQIGYAPSFFGAFAAVILARAPARNHHSSPAATNLRWTDSWLPAAIRTLFDSLTLYLVLKNSPGPLAFFALFASTAGLIPLTHRDAPAPYLLAISATLIGIICFLLTGFGWDWAWDWVLASLEMTRPQPEIAAQLLKILAVVFPVFVLVELVIARVFYRG